MSETPERAAEGYVWVPDTYWEASDEDRKCRQQGCPNRAVAKLRRARGKGWAWWHYCDEHLYGRRIEKGVVLIRVHPDSPAAERGKVGL